MTDAQALARHQSSLTTMGVYAHPLGDAAKRAADLLPMPELLPGSNADRVDTTPADG